MRIDSSTMLDLRRRFALPALLLTTVLFGAACHEADGTEEWPGVYPHEKDIDRPKGAKDAGRPADAGSDASSADGGTSGDGGASDDAATDASSTDGAAGSDAN